MDQHQRFLGVRHFGSLDALRAFSILGVVWYHAPALPLERQITTDAGASGVALFFVISGFLITTLLLREEASRGVVSLRNFYIRRTLRIFPLYYATLLLYLGIVLVRERQGDGRLNGAGELFVHNLPYFFTYTSNWFVDQIRTRDGDHRVLFMFAWSLATEEQFYLMWPTVLRWLRRRWAMAFMLFVLAVDLGASFAFGLMKLPQNPLERAVKIAQSPSTEIILGVLLALALNHRATFGRLWSILGRSWSVPLWAAGALATAMLPVPAGPGWYTLQAAVFTGLVGSCVIREDHVLARLFRFPLLVRIGVVSYGMYLLHMLAVNTVKALVMPRLGITSPWFWSFASMAAAYLAAEASFFLFESRILRLKERFSAQRPA